jgi:hypothetical protein
MPEHQDTASNHVHIMAIVAYLGSVKDVVVVGEQCLRSTQAYEVAPGSVLWVTSQRKDSHQARQ